MSRARAGSAFDRVLAQRWDQRAADGVLRYRLDGVVTVVDRQEGAGEAFAAAGLTLTPILTLEDFK